MNKIILTALVLLCAAVSSFAQSKTPQAVLEAFNKKFPNATKVKWEKENAKEFEASFNLKGVDYSANYSDTGEWMETESTIDFNDLPNSVKATFNASHPNTKVKEVAKIETSKGQTQFEVEIKQGMKTVEFLYNSDGTEIK
jgi:hypothetical protein